MKNEFMKSVLQFESKLHGGWEKSSLSYCLSAT